MYHYIKQIKKIPKVITFHDISTKVYERSMNQGNKLNRRSFEIVKKLEPVIANKFQAVVTLSEVDRLYLYSLGCKRNIYVIPPQVKIPQLIDVKKRSNEICFIGSYNREPNIQAVNILIDEINQSVITFAPLLNLILDNPEYLKNPKKLLEKVILPNIGSIPALKNLGVTELDNVIDNMTKGTQGVNKVLTMFNDLVAKYTKNP